MRVRTQLMLWCLLFLAMMLAIGTVGALATRSQSDAMLGFYKDRVVPLSQLKKVADLYAVNIVDAAHKAAAGSFSPSQAAAAASLRQQAQKLAQSVSVFRVVKEGQTD